MYPYLTFVELVESLQREAKLYNQGYTENLNWMQLFKPYTPGLDHKTILTWQVT